ncbi:MAG: hypothetical protein IJ594_02470 [Oscillospiraceae bacterium]|nr:hypothetical protein [Oscillospiraceae bacterium]
MARNQEFYKGSRKKRNYAIVPFVIVLGLLAVIVVLFYSMQKYAVISKDGVDVLLPGMEREETTIDSEGNVVRVFDEVTTELVFTEPDYSRVTATAGRYATPIKAIFVGADELKRDLLLKYEERLNDGNALILEMKPRTGRLMWQSESDLAVSYGIGSSSDLGSTMAPILTEMREAAAARNHEIYLAAQISCCIDDVLASRSDKFALRTDYGANYTDDNGTWLDPYNVDVRHYIAQLVQELFDMGFDEVILADLLHPTATREEGEDPVVFQYSREMSTTPNPVTAVCGFAVYVADELSGRTRNQRLSVYVDSAPALVRNDTDNGQNAVLFLKLYDRVYYRTDRYVYSYNLEDVQGSVTIGKAQDRFVPVVINYLPHENSSWVLIDTETDMATFGQTDE